MVTVLVLSLVLFLIGATGLYIATSNLRATAADTKLNIAEKAANAGILAATDYIHRIGFCANQQQNNVSFGNATYSYDITRSGRICFIRATGNMANARVVKTSIIQSYYGVGLYTVRGNVNASLGGSNVRLSGCDSTINPICYMPAFIASGTITTNVQERQCSQDSGGSGLYGNPAVLRNVIFDDLIPLFFNVNCFNRYSSGSSCETATDKSLLEVFEEEFARINPLTNQKELRFNNPQGIPVLDMDINNPDSIMGRANTRKNSITSPCYYNEYQLNLSTQLTNCDEVRVGGGVRVITGTRSSRPLTIYALDWGYDIKFENTGTNPQWVTIYSNRQLVISNATNFTVYTIATSTNTTPVFRGTIGQSDNNNASTVSFRFFSTRTVYVDSGATLRNGTIIIAPTNVNETNNIDAPQNLVANGNFTMDDINLFTRRIQFADSSTVNIWNSVIFVYAYACPNCSRATSTSSLDACGTGSETRWCGWYGNGITLNLGRDTSATDQEKPTVFISNNTTVRTDYPGGTSIWGAWVGEDVTYLRWVGSSITQNFRGFLVRNFPPNLTLQINISSNFNMSFKKSILDKLSNKYWWFRKVDCVLDDMSPGTQLIQTRMTTY
ncbi:MAG: hypothetical protein QXN68_03405 [Thermoplasmata archaeon]